MILKHEEKRRETLIQIVLQFSNSIAVLSNRPLTDSINCYLNVHRRETPGGLGVKQICFALACTITRMG